MLHGIGTSYSSNLTPLDLERLWGEVPPEQAVEQLPPEAWSLLDQLITGQGALPKELIEKLSKRGDAAVETPDELKSLLQQLHQSEQGLRPGDAQASQGPSQFPGLQEMLQLLIDYFANQYHQGKDLGRMNARSPGRVARANNNWGGGSAPQPQASGGGGRMSPSGGGSAPQETVNVSGGASPTAGQGGAEQWRETAERYVQAHGLPPDAVDHVLALIQTESSGRTDAIGDNGHSVGLFQLHDRGVGHGMSVEQRKDPKVQFDAMMPRIKAAYESGRAQGLSGAQLTVHIAREAERPAEANLPKYGVAYNQITGRA